MATYLVDYENVHHHGLAGIEKLSEDDFLVIFIGNKDKTMPVDAAIAISKTNANVLWKRSEKTAPNYLDIQLASYLGSLVGESKGEEFYIISKDLGFVAAVDFWSPRKPGMKFALQETVSGKPVATVAEKQVGQQPLQPTTIDGKIKASVKKKIATILTDHNLIGGNFTKVYALFNKAKTKDQFLSAMKSAYQGDKYIKLGEELLPIYVEYLAGK